MPIAQKEEERYIKLLRDSSSEETEKARRNTSFISFIIISMWFLEASLQELPILRIHVCPENEWKLLFIAMILSIFWIYMFLINHLRDYKIYNLQLTNYLDKEYNIALEELEDLKNYQTLYELVTSLNNKEKSETHHHEKELIHEKKLEKIAEIKELQHKLIWRWKYSEEEYKNFEFTDKRRIALEIRTETFEDFKKTNFNPTNKISININRINITVPVLLFLWSYYILLELLLNSHAVIFFIESILTTSLLIYCYCFHSIYHHL